ncbi:MAG: Oxidoreductase FAD/NAD(P)-binding domain protein [Candidatus Nomurabacteria bacterium GW2011_GWE1_32_28]|uniref:Oxidoreductase FAD/NAD(P)-binding domain protein n=1 Tax=Candidatus Nomurabacteria bacterium GW2011_GWF1_31_48 TaxID=1618767 RepID=A0A0F9YF01_9BACT|nr:MAG: Oxidoreductase FAD/NAD(P)-binding domain protein [Candidatus Nomurabacteria bacterium GW2011_GWF2_30_133]KKP28373.1 MAG: Oxidoreductase FAD/NAD(P)-binding domain protein [Candidatus Nomurabacteria bacterium GW2011_GWE2_31_40]KKP29958.1 MAG: Oxidoreductase FAD/NAD(P)-binding domain protein [Candidatus Nomurabacteria bacterium GW2011_GWF1_31_48]KKP35115.1 MAG: Oxidoreductase FAD/NAD(P)-binding domain protein [Candidatus Nomurabacteria bacterium GW2011_GWE1_32_28]HAS80927.1 hypothetical pr
MNIKKITGKINNVVDLSKTAKEISINLSEPIDFISGSFMNVFIDINGEKVRRAYSISSSSLENKNITFTIRLSPVGLLTPLFWKKDMIGEDIEMMGPLGLNTVDKMKQDKIYLFAFGVGAGVVKSIASYFFNQKNIKSLTILTGSKSEDEILYKDYFNSLSLGSGNVFVDHIVSRTREGSTIKKGYIQDYINEFDFNNSDVYVCGKEKACNDLVEKIKLMNPSDCNYFIEGFH